MDNFKKALETLNNHANHEYHKLALLKADRFLNICMLKEPEIINSINVERNKQVIENRKRLTYIIECIMLCGRQEFALTLKDLASSILNGLNSCGINCNNIYGHGYDGASNMSGHIKGVQTIIRTQYPKALYVHTCAQTLNIVVSSACNIQPIRNCLGTVQKMYCFFNFSKRQNVILTAIDESDLEPKIKNLKHVQHKTISECSDVSSVDANLLLKSMDFTFLIFLQVIKVLFSYGQPLCKQLQQIEIDLREAVGTADDNGFQCLFSYESDDPSVEFNELVKFYFPEVGIDTVRAEFKMWNVKLKQLNEQPKTGLDALKYCFELIYLNLSKLLFIKIFITLPVSTATPERMFSCLKKIKTYLRNTMKEE